MFANMTCNTFIVVLISSISFSIALPNPTQSNAVGKDVTGTRYVTDEIDRTIEGAVGPSQPTMGITTENISAAYPATTSGNTQSNAVERDVNGTRYVTDEPDSTIEGAVGPSQPTTENISDNTAEAEDFLYTGFGEFLVTRTSLHSLQDILRLDPALVYLTLNFLNLNFDNETAYLNDSPSVIDPLTWTWASEDKGYFLRSLPPNYLYLSFGTLNSDVYKTSIDVVANNSADFLNTDDLDKLQRLSEFLNKVFLHTYDANNQTQTEFKVCQEFFSAETGTATVWSLLLSVHVYMYLPSSFQVICWSSVDNVPHTQSNDSMSFLALLYYVAILLGTLYVPIVISTFIIQNHQPQREKQNGKTYYYYDKASCPPVGLKYWLLFWGNVRYQWLYGFRIITFIAIIVLGSYVEDIILRFSDSHTIRLHSAYRSVVNGRAYIIVTIVLYLTFPCFIAKPVSKFLCQHDQDKKSPYLEIEHQRKMVFFHYPLKHVVPEASNSGPWCNKFHHYMKRRMLMALDYRIIWSLVSELVSNKSGSLRIMLIKLPIAFVSWVFVILLNSPTFYIMQWLCGIRQKPPKGDPDRKGDIKRWFIRVSTFLLPVLALYSILLWVIIRLMTGISSLIIHILQYTFTGVLINHFSLNPYFFMALSLTSYCFKINKDFMMDYYKLKNMIIDVKEQKQKKSKKKLDYDKLKNIIIERKEKKKPEEPEEQSGGVTISQECFWKVVDECKPVRVDIALRSAAIALIAILMYATFSILTQTDMLVSNSDSLISTIIVSFVLPFALKKGMDSVEDQYDLKARIEKVHDRYERGKPVDSLVDSSETGEPLLEKGDNYWALWDEFKLTEEHVE